MKFKCFIFLSFFSAINANTNEFVNNIIFNNFLVKTLDFNSLNVVITGDSHVAGYGYLIPNVKYARFTLPTDNYPGIRTWSFILRDLFYRIDPYFIHSDALKYNFSDTTNVSFYTHDNESFGFHFPFNNRVTKLSTANNEHISIINDITINNKRLILYTATTKSADACSFDIYINDKFYKSICNYTDNSTYKGYNIKKIIINTDRNTINKIEFKNILNYFNPTSTEQSLNTIYLLGIGSDNINYFNTAKSGVTFKYIYNNINELILSHSPDIVIINGGLCDVYLNFALPDGIVPLNEFESLLIKIIESITENNPDTKIIFTTATPHKAHPVDKLISYNEIIKKVALSNKCSLIDLYKFFIDKDNYRVDNAHYNFYGHTEVAKLFNLYFFKGYNLPEDYMISDFIFK